MAVTNFELENYNGRYVLAVDFADNEYQGFLHYRPIADPQFPIQLWKHGDCCYITYLQPEDVELITPTSPKFTQNNIYHMPPHLMQAAFFPNFIKTPYCDHMPEVLLMDVIEADDPYKCLINELYILEWDFNKKQYELNYPAICGCSNFYIRLVCTDAGWILYAALINLESACVNGFNLNFPIENNTLRGKGKIDFRQTGDCDCGPNVDGGVTILIRPIR